MNQRANYQQLCCSCNATGVRGTKNARTSQGSRNITFISSGTEQGRDSQPRITSGNIYLTAYTGWIYRIPRPHRLLLVIQNISFTIKQGKERQTDIPLSQLIVADSKTDRPLSESEIRGFVLHTVIFHGPSHIDPPTQYAFIHYLFIQYLIFEYHCVPLSSPLSFLIYFRKCSKYMVREIHILLYFSNLSNPWNIGKCLYIIYIDTHTYI